MAPGSFALLFILCLARHGGVASNGVALSVCLADAECPEVAASASQDDDLFALLQLHGGSRGRDVKDFNIRSDDIGSDRDESWTGLAEPLVLQTAGLEAPRPGIRHIVAAPEAVPHDAPQRAIQRDRVSFKVRDVAPAEPHVDIVVTWHCDKLDWLKDISPTLAPVITIVLLHKLNPDERCNETIPEVPFALVKVQMPNRGRDVHSQFSYASNNYDVLPTYTMFLQADNHWVINGHRKGHKDVHHFESNGYAVNDLVALALQGRKSFYPVVPYLRGHPVLFVDRESNIDEEAQDVNMDPYLTKFGDCWLDMFNQVRDTIRSIFGGNPCDLPETVFVPGFQYLASRENILARPREVWASLGDMSLACGAATYAIERLGITLFNESRPALDPNTWKLPNYCPSLDKNYFSWQHRNDVLSRQESLSRTATRSEFWRKTWGCEPLSAFLRSRMNNSGAVRS